MDEECGNGWRAEFYDFLKPPPSLIDEKLTSLASFGDIHVRAARNADRHGTPGQPEGLLSLDAIGPDERRLLFCRTAEGPEPLALWLEPSGLPKKPDGWEGTCQAANARIAEKWVRWTAPELEGEERKRRKELCPLWARPHMCRHSFALKWFSLLSMVWQPSVNGFTARELADLREQFGDVWYALSERDFIALIDGTHRLVKVPIVLVWDRLSTHVSLAMRELIAECEWLTVFVLPAYSPDLNPVGGYGPTSSTAWPTSPWSPSTGSKSWSATGSNASSTGPTPSTAS